MADEAGEFVPKLILELKAFWMVYAGAFGFGLLGAEPEIFRHEAPLKTCISPKFPQSTHQIVSPATGAIIANLLAFDILEGKKPEVVLDRSNTAEDAGVLVPIPICEKANALKSKWHTKKKIRFDITIFIISVLKK